METAAPLFQQLGIAGVVVAVLVIGLRWMAAMFLAANNRAQVMHDKCEERQADLVKHMEEVQLTQLDRNSNAMHAMAKALDSLAVAINDTRTPTHPMKVPTQHNIIPPAGHHA